PSAVGRVSCSTATSFFDDAAELRVFLSFPTRRSSDLEMILNHLADTYGLDGDGASDLAAALRQIAEEMAADSLEEAMDGIGYAIPGTFLEGLDDDTIRVEFRTLLATSAFYSLSRRCGLDPREYLDEADFSSITDYNDLSVLAFLGNATSQLVEPILRDIGRTIRQAELEEWRKQAE